MQRILVVNRGECALRIFRTCDRMGIPTVGIYTDDDSASLHVSAAGTAFKVSNYTHVEDILGVIRILQDTHSGSLGVHPGYGFLSENAAFATLVTEAGAVWIGPSAQVMEKLGKKDQALSIARTLCIPVNEGSPIVHSAAEAVEWARESRVEYPLIVKPTDGGGGIGMRIVRSEAELLDDAAFVNMQNLCVRCFGEEGSGMFVEKYIVSARHIEVQVFGDGKGNAIHIGERECSVQRRNQKVIEESPSAGISTAVRERLCEHAMVLCKALRYESCGTVEFVYDTKDEQFFFLEVNTRLQVEHGVTEMVNNIDLVEWMIRQAGDSDFDICNTFVWNPSGHCIQARIYAEDCGNGFRPCLGVLQEWDLPTASTSARFETHCSRGFSINASYDPLIVKILQWGPTRYIATKRMVQVLEACVIGGPPNNLPLLRQFIDTQLFANALTFTTTLETYVKKHFQNSAVEVVKPGMNLMVQDFPGRTQQGMWRVGIPPSGAFDHLACRLANSLVSNTEDAAVFECLLLVDGPGLALTFRCDTTVAITGVQCHIRRAHENYNLPQYTAIAVFAGETLEVSRQKGCSPEGCRCYVSIYGGINVPKYLGSRSTFTAGEFGGYQGRALQPGDVLPIGESTGNSHERKTLPTHLWPVHQKNWSIGVLPGPRANPDFMTDEDICLLHTTQWQVHHNSNRLGIRLIGPKPQWSRKSGEEGGSHPSNIHDEEYAVGTINFTGDMPIIITHDGPSLGGFVCPITIVQSELWKIGQLQAGDTITFVVMTLQQAMRARIEQDSFILTLKPGKDADHPAIAALQNTLTHAVVFTKPANSNGHPGMVIRLAGDKHVLVEYGPMVLDLTLRVRVHFLERALLDPAVRPVGLEETGPGVRSLQIRYDPLVLPLPQLIELLGWVDSFRIAEDISSSSIPSRVFRLPMAFNTQGCKDAMAQYSKSVRSDAPYLPCNIEYIAKNNGLTTQDVYERCFRASYMVLGLGDVYLGACCAVPVDPRDRMITSKMNPARTWTEEGTVGLGGAFMCIYPMNSPGGYQLVGRTLPIWNTWENLPMFSSGKPWMLNMFDQIRFFPCTEQELHSMREQFSQGTYVPEMTIEDFHLTEHTQFLDSIKSDVEEYKARQKIALDIGVEEEARSQERLQSVAQKMPELTVPDAVPKHHVCVEAPISGNMWEIAAQIRCTVSAGDVLFVVEAMKMQFTVTSPVDGVVMDIRATEGKTVHAGVVLVVVAPLDECVSFSPPSPCRSRKTVFSLQIPALQKAYAEGVSVFNVVNQIFDAIEQRDIANDEDNYGNIWISLASRSEVHQYIHTLHRFSPSTAPLYGIPFAVKDNIDVAGYTTTAGCPGYKTKKATRNATCVQKLLDAGAVFIGKTNLDQFATGLVGTRSPYGECYNSFHPDYISGGSSSGSAVAVSLGFASFSLGTDTAGSGRVPASLNNIVGLKPSRGLISTTGVVPACRSLDCVSIFSLTAFDADVCLKVMQGEDEEDMYTRRVPAGPCTILRRVGVPYAQQLKFFDNDQGHLAFDHCVRLLQETHQVEVHYIDYGPFLEAAALLYDGPWVTERFVALEEAIDRCDVLDVTRKIILSGKHLTAADAFQGMYRLQQLRKTIDALFHSDIDVMMTPTVGTCWKRARIHQDPIQANTDNGYYTNFVNLLDMAAIAVPCSFVQMEGALMPFGVTFSCPAFQEESLVCLATRLQQCTNLPLGNVGECLDPESNTETGARAQL